MKYKKITKQEYEDRMYELVDSINLSKEEKESFDILINRFSLTLQKINENIENNKFDNIKKEILNYLKKE